MKKLLLLLLVLPFCALAQVDSLQLSKTQRESARAVAKLWVSELTKAQDIDLLVSISAVPFNFDRKETLTTLDEVKKFYLKIIEDKGERIVPSLKAEIHEVKNPEAITVQVSFTYKDRVREVFVDVVQREGKYKVSGFAD